jgi:PTH1 family peptidyl-tRNA hydrolase
MSGKLIVGLGNIGAEYLDTRHNAGFSVVEALAARDNAEFKQVRDFQAFIAKVSFQNQNAILAKPTTYMNLSGQAVNAIVRYFKIELADLIVVHDDVALPLGKIRFQKAGGAGGQHGVESIIQSLGGSKAFDRLKVGVGPDPGGAVRAHYVLAKIPQSQQELYRKVISLSAEAVVHWMSKDVTSAMNTFNNVNLDPPVDEDSDKEPG